MSIRKQCDLCDKQSINNYEKNCVSCFNKNHIPYTIYCDDTTFFLGSPTNKIHQNKYLETFCNNEDRELYNVKLYRFIRDNGGYAFENFEINLIDKNVMKFKRKLK
jgi:hypothetical protein